MEELDRLVAHLIEAPAEAEAVLKDKNALGMLSQHPEKIMEMLSQAEPELNNALEGVQKELIEQSRQSGKIPDAMMASIICLNAIQAKSPAEAKERLQSAEKYIKAFSKALQKSMMQTIKSGTSTETRGNRRAWKNLIDAFNAGHLEQVDNALDVLKKNAELQGSVDEVARAFILGQYAEKINLINEYGKNQTPYKDLIIQLANRYDLMNDEKLDWLKEVANKVFDVNLDKLLASDLVERIKREDDFDEMINMINQNKNLFQRYPELIAAFEEDDTALQALEEAGVIQREEEESVEEQKTARMIEEGEARELYQNILNARDQDAIHQLLLDNTEVYEVYSDLINVALKERHVDSDAFDPNLRHAAEGAVNHITQLEHDAAIDFINDHRSIFNHIFAYQPDLIQRLSDDRVAHAALQQVGLIKIDRDDALSICHQILNAERVEEALDLILRHESMFRNYPEYIDYLKNQQNNMVNTAVFFANIVDDPAFDAMLVMTGFLAKGQDPKEAFDFYQEALNDPVRGPGIIKALLQVESEPVLALLKDVRFFEDKSGSSWSELKEQFDALIGNAPAKEIQNVDKQSASIHEAETLGRVFILSDQIKEPSLRVALGQKAQVLFENALDDISKEENISFSELKSFLDYAARYVKAGFEWVENYTVKQQALFDKILAQYPVDDPAMDLAARVIQLKSFQEGIEVLGSNKAHFLAREAKLREVCDEKLDACLQKPLIELLASTDVAAIKFAGKESALAEKIKRERDTITDDAVIHKMQLILNSNDDLLEKAIQLHTLMGNYVEHMGEMSQTFYEAYQRQVIVLTEAMAQELYALDCDFVKRLDVPEIPEDSSADFKVVRKAGGSFKKEFGEKSISNPLIYKIAEALYKSGNISTAVLMCRQLFALCQKSEAQGDVHAMRSIFMVFEQNGLQKTVIPAFLATCTEAEKIQYGAWVQLFNPSGNMKNLRAYHHEPHVRVPFLGVWAQDIEPIIGQEVSPEGVPALLMALRKVYQDIRGIKQRLSDVTVGDVQKPRWYRDVTAVSKTQSDIAENVLGNFLQKVMPMRLTQLLRWDKNFYRTASIKVRMQKYEPMKDTNSTTTYYLLKALVEFREKSRKVAHENDVKALENMIRIAEGVVDSQKEDYEAGHLNDIQSYKELMAEIVFVKESMERRLARVDIVPQVQQASFEENAPAELADIKAMFERSAMSLEESTQETDSHQPMRELLEDELDGMDALLRDEGTEDNSEDSDNTEVLHVLVDKPFYKENSAQVQADMNANMLYRRLQQQETKEGMINEAKRLFEDPRGNNVQFLLRSPKVMAMIDKKFPEAMKIFRQKITLEDLLKRELFLQAQKKIVEETPEFRDAVANSTLLDKAEYRALDDVLFRQRLHDVRMNISEGQSSTRRYQDCLSVLRNVVDPKVAVLLINAFNRAYESGACSKLPPVNQMEKIVDHINDVLRAKKGPGLTHAGLLKILDNVGQADKKTSAMFHALFDIPKSDFPREGIRPVTVVPAAPAKNAEAPKSNMRQSK